jgi:hypothetical protein
VVAGLVVVVVVVMVLPPEILVSCTFEYTRIVSLSSCGVKYFLRTAPHLGGGEWQRGLRRAGAGTARR